MNRVLHWIVTAWCILGVTFLLVLAIDVALRYLIVDDMAAATVVADATAPSRKNAEALHQLPVAEYFSEFRAANDTQWEPYVYWRRTAYSGAMINVDEDGIRASWSDANATEKDVTIWVTGGSTVWGTGARDAFTIPSQIAKELAAVGIRADVVNLGESGYVSGQSLIAVQRRLAKYPAPDLVVSYEGVNDVYSALQAGHAGIPQNESHRVKEFRSLDGVEGWLKAFPKSLEGIQALAGLSAQRPVFNAASLGAEVAGHYANNVRQLRALGDAYGFSVMAFWQPTIFTKGELSEHEQQVVAASLIRHRELQLASNKSISAYANQVIDLSDLFLESTPRYLDFCHVGEDANAVIAEAISDVILQSGYAQRS